MSSRTWDSDWPAPAKLNLFLHVVGRRADGYHLLQTVFRFIDRMDGLRFEPRPDNRIVLAAPLPGVAAEDDLTVRAARLLQAATGCGQGATIHLAKNLPLGGGLGGGSSDAATVLLALNHLWATGVSRADLEKLGLQLGADVPVFIHGRNTFAEGVGERFSDVNLPPETYLVLHPAVNVPTAAIFGAPDLRRDTIPLAPAVMAPRPGPQRPRGGRLREIPGGRRASRLAQAIRPRRDDDRLRRLRLRRVRRPRYSGSGLRPIAAGDERLARRRFARPPAGRSLKTLDFRGWLL